MDEFRIFCGMPYTDEYGYERVPVYLDRRIVSIQDNDAAAVRYAARLAEELGCEYDVDTP